MQFYELLKRRFFFFVSIIIQKIGFYFLMWPFSRVIRLPSKYRYTLGLYKRPLFNFQRYLHTMPPSVQTLQSSDNTTLNYLQRKKLGLTGLLPCGTDNLEIQHRRALAQVRSKSTPLEKYIFMSQLRSTNYSLFYRLVMNHLDEFAPVIYTPTVGTACLEFSNIYPSLAQSGMTDGLYIDSNRLDDLDDILFNYRSDFDPQVAVITDGSRILGLGDLGMNGMGISMGKLQLYVAGAGIDPRRTLPIVLDMGTNNTQLRQNEFYLGLNQSRPDDKQFYEKVDVVIKALNKAFPKMLIQFEDWSTEHAITLLEKYREKMLCFNDDIQGTGAVILSGVIKAVKKVHQETGLDPKKHRIVFYGAGSAAIGVAQQIQYYFKEEHGLSEQEAKNMFWIVDSKGLVTSDRGDRLAQHKVYFARDDNQGSQYKELLDIVDYVKPTALIGLSSTPGAFHSQALQRLSELTPLPIIFPLSNPATQAECTFAEALENTGNRAIFASGTAFPPYKIPNTNNTLIPAQGNNMYIFPGLGLGAVLSQSKQISDEMLFAASKALADDPCEELYPPLSKIRSTSLKVALAVIKTSIKQGFCQESSLIEKSDEELLALISNQIWSP
ncbi:hypothetical protein BY458DRAFT_514800 [Sporodiniella umbellata]|nr:hypothetical protein BY458DRAFT_514800 [Sporodiniella umbellata]